MHVNNLHDFFHEFFKFILVCKFNTKEEVVALVGLQQSAWQLHLFEKSLVKLWTWDPVLGSMLVNVS